MRTRIKICGITQVACLRRAVALGADALGFNMFPQSPRYLEVAQAKLLVAEVPSFVSSVGLFVNEQAEVVTSKTQEIGFDLLQFHGDESNEFCRQFGKPFIKVLRIKEASDLKRVSDFPDARGFLFDAHVEGLYGGTGQRIDSALLQDLPDHSILAGGLNPNNVAQAVEQLKPFAVDVSSGVERQAGCKDPELMDEFFQAVAAAHRRTT
ncbi:MAG: phosphoribosylanthranilate isomerase [Pseudomonadales bacterium]